MISHYKYNRFGCQYKVINSQNYIFLSTFGWQYKIIYSQIYTFYTTFGCWYKPIDGL